MGTKVTEPEKEKYIQLRRMGFSQALAAKEIHRSVGWAEGFERNLRNSSGAEWRAARENKKIPGPLRYEELKPEAQRAWDDFEYFRLRYFGHVSTPWQIETAHRIVDLLQTPDREYVCENVEPGVGKSTLKHDIQAWLTVRDRRIRGLDGSRVENNARRALRRLRRSLERTTPVKARPEAVQAGLAVDAEACLSADFGTFKPLTSDVWKADEFIVAQYDDEAIEEKEPTWSCYGMDSGVLGNRFNFIAWDDVVTKETIRTLDAIEAQRDWWDTEGETRLEPGGLLWLIGQRMSASDLYRYCLDKTTAEEDDEDSERPKKYHHIVYKGHYEEKCSGHEGADRDLPPYPEGCLLDPKRVPWKGKEGLRTIQQNKPRVFAVQYQQTDADPEDTLVKEIWIAGGIDPEDKQMYPGCWDENRDICQLPKGLAGPLHSIASVDPSGKKMWATEWWVHAPEASNQSFLMDLERKAMPANELLDWDANEGKFYGLMEEWQARSVLLGYPITTWIVEVNAAQRYLLAYDHVRRWMSKWKVAILPHTTGPRKLDEDHGPWIMRDHFKFGRIRLPGKQLTQARFKSLKLVDEAVRWPNAGVTDDCVMAAWFQFLHLPNLAVDRSKGRKLWRPSWVRQSA